MNTERPNSSGSEATFRVSSEEAESPLPNSSGDLRSLTELVVKEAFSPLPIPKIYVCNFCEKKYKTRSGLKYHSKHCTKIISPVSFDESSYVRSTVDVSAPTSPHIETEANINPLLNRILPPDPATWHSPRLVFLPRDCDYVFRPVVGDDAGNEVEASKPEKLGEQTLKEATRNGNPPCQTRPATTSPTELVVKRLPFLVAPCQTLQVCVPMKLPCHNLRNIQIFLVYYNKISTSIFFVGYTIIMVIIFYQYLQEMDTKN